MRPLDRPLAALVLALSTACASADMALEIEDLDSGSDESAVPSQLRLDVYPSDASPGLAQQSVLLDLDGNWRGLGIEVAPSVELSGTVQGFLATPYLPSDPTVPGEDDAPIAATVALTLDDSVAGGTSNTAEDGAFSLLVPPGRDYRLEIVPEDTDRVPFAVESIPVLASDLDLGTLYLDFGAPVWGQVSFSDGSVPAGARVHLVDDESGVSGPETVVDADGWYQLRAYPGDYTLVVQGRTGGTVPTIELPLSFDDDEGARVDVDVGPTERIDLSGYLVDSSGEPLVSGGQDWRYTVRGTALDLRDVDGELVVETFTTTTGFQLDLAPGTWRLELIPPFEGGLSPRTLDLQVADTDIDLGDLVLANWVPLLALVLDPEGEAAPGVLVVATELSYDGYTYSGTTGADGRTSMELPQGLLELTMTPPDANSAAITRVTVDTAADSVDELQLAAGVPVQGILSSEGEPVPYALVEVRDADGKLYGSALSDEEGGFSMRVDSKPSATTD